MKTVLLSIFVLVASNFYVDGQEITITGISDTIRLFRLTRTTQNGLLSVTDTIQFNSNKTFAHKIRVDRPTLAFLNAGDDNFTILLVPGYPFHSEFRNGEVTFTGPGAAFANYYKAKDSTVARYSRHYVVAHPGFNNTAGDVLAYLDSVTQNEESFLKAHLTKLKRRDRQTLMGQEKVSILYKNLYSKLVFSGSDIRQFKYFQNVYNVKKPGYYTYSDKIDLDNHMLLSNVYFQLFAAQFVADIALEKQRKLNKPFSIGLYIDLAMKAADELTMSSRAAIECKILLLNKVTEEIEREKKLQWTDKIYETLRLLTRHNDNTGLTLVKQKLDKVIADTRFQKGKQAPDFVLNDSTGKQYSLTDFKGKKVYIDIGASWCGPCTQGIPLWNKLIEANQGNKNIIFISLSLDTDRKAWERWVKKHKPMGLLLHAGFQGFESRFAKAYQVLSLPKFILLDEQGKIDDYNAPAPGSSEIDGKIR